MDQSLLLFQYKDLWHSDVFVSVSRKETDVINISLWLTADSRGGQSHVSGRKPSTGPGPLWASQIDDSLCFWSSTAGSDAELCTRIITWRGAGEGISLDLISSFPPDRSLTKATSKIWVCFHFPETLHNLNFFSIFFFFFLQHKTSKNVHQLECFLTKADVSQFFSAAESKVFFCSVDVLLLSLEEQTCQTALALAFSVSVLYLLVPLGTSTPEHRSPFTGFCSDSEGVDVLLSVLHLQISGLRLKLSTRRSRQRSEAASRIVWLKC